MIYKSPLKFQHAFLKERDIVIGEDKKMYSIVLHKRGGLYRTRSVGCSACCFSESHGCGTATCALNETLKIMGLDSKEVKQSLNSCFAFTKKLMETYYVSFKEIKGGI